MNEVDVTLIDLALAEDLPHGDISSRWLHPETVQIEVRMRDPGILCGIGFLHSVYDRLAEKLACTSGPIITLAANDGDSVEAGALVAELNGDIALLLAGERTCLNFMMRLSGLATRARAIRERFPASITVVDTRKTTPGWRRLEKYAFRIGGLVNHRMSLSEAVLLKDNHFPYCGGDIVRGPLTPLEVEIDRIDQLKKALTFQPDVLMLDNFSAAAVNEIVPLIPESVHIELSGNMNAEHWTRLWNECSDESRQRLRFVSIGRDLQFASWLDIGFDLKSDEQ